MACVDLLPIVVQDSVDDNNNKKNNNDDPKTVDFPQDKNKNSKSKSKTRSLTKIFKKGRNNNNNNNNQDGCELDSGKADGMIRINFLDQFVEIKEEIESIKQESIKIDELSQKVDLCDKKSDKEKLIDDCNVIIKNTIQLNNQLRNKIGKVKNDFDRNRNNKNKNNNGNSNQVELQWFENEMNYCHQHFYQKQLEFSQSINNFNIKFADTTKRKVNVLFGRNSQVSRQLMSSEELETVLNDPSKSMGFLEMSMQMQLNDDNNSMNNMSTNQVCDQVLDELSKQELKYNHMLEIESSMNELCQLWNELLYLLDSQQTQIDSITERVIQSQDAIKNATKELEHAEKDQKKVRKMKATVLFTVVVVGAVVVIVLV